MSFRERIFTFRNDGPVIANTAVATSIFPAGRRKAVPNGYFASEDPELWLDVDGKISHLASATLTVLLQLTGVTVWTSGALTLPASAPTNAELHLLMKFTGSTVGAGSAGKLIASGELVVNGTRIGMPNAGVEGSGFDMEWGGLADVLLQWGAASASNSAQILQGGPSIWSS